MLTLLDILTLPRAKFNAILTLFFRAVRPIVRYVLTLSSSPKTPHLALPIHQYAPLKLDPPPAPLPLRYEPWNGVRDVSLWTGTPPNLRGQHLYSVAIIFSLGLLIVAASVLYTVVESCRCPRQHVEASCATHIAEVYTSITGKPYVPSRWELMLPHKPPESFYCSDSDVDLEFGSGDSTSFDSGFGGMSITPSFPLWLTCCSVESIQEIDTSTSLCLSGVSVLTTSPDILGPCFAHLINEKVVDEYVKLLTDEGYTEPQFRFHHRRDHDSSAILVDGEFSARADDIVIFMDTTLRITPIAYVPLTRTDLILWDVGGGRFKAVELLAVTVTSRNHVEDDGNIFLDRSSDFDPPAGNLFDSSPARKTWLDSLMDVDTDSDESFVFDREPAFVFGSTPTRRPSFTFSADLSDESPADTSTDSDLHEDHLRGLDIPSAPRGRQSPVLRSLTSTPKKHVSSEDMAGGMFL